jgi:hypothetical protein
MTLALLGALVIGLSLGLLGSGGSILTVPVLVFILQRPEKLAIAESLAIVGSVACMGALPYALRKNIHWKSVFFFGLPGMLGAYVGACGSYYISGTVQLIVFAFVMLIVAGVMFFGPPSFDQFAPLQDGIWLTALEGFLVGCLTGFIGVGGGFLIVPALVLLSHLSMHFAIGTSLIIIAMNSFTGFIEQLFVLSKLQMQVDWQMIAIIATAGILGSLIGSLVAKKISQIHLRQTFGIGVLVMGIYILINRL